MEFLIDIDPELKTPEYKMTLCKLNEEPLMTLKNFTDFSYKAAFSSIDEIHFKIPLYRTDIEGEKVENERYHAVKGDMLIKLNNMKFFYIHYVKEIESSSGEIFKEVQAYSREYEFSQKKLLGYEAEARKIYTYPVHGEGPITDENGLKIGFLNYVEDITSWKVGYVNNNILNKYRALSFSNTNLLQAFQDVQKTFGCLFQFDTINKIINVYEVTEFESDNGFYISDKNFLQSIEKGIKSDEIKTRLYLYGKDNISIQEMNITGKPYLEDFSFYKNTDYMSQELIDALDHYDKVIQEEDGKFQQHMKELDKYTPLYREAIDDLIEERNKLREAEMMLDTILARPYETPEERHEALEEQKKVVLEHEKLVEEKKERLQSIEDTMNSIHLNIAELRKRIIDKGALSEKLARELDSFIKEETLMESNYTEATLDELYKDGQDALRRISQPVIQFKVDVVDFLSLVEYQHHWNKFNLGDTIHLFHKELNFDYHVRLVGYTHAVSDNNLTLEFSSTGTIDDPNLYLKDLLDEFKTTSGSVDFSRYKWDKGEEANHTINKYIDSNFDLAKQALETADGQVTVLDHRGYWGTKLNEDGTESPEKLRMTNNVIAMTKDNWNTVDIAISPVFGINANLINGKLGNFATLNANQIFVGDDDDTPLLEFVDDEILASFEGLDQAIQGAFDDNFLTNIEANNIKLAFGNMKGESSNLIREAMDLGIVNERRDYEEALKDLEDYLFKKWLDQDKYPIPISEKERITINDKFSRLEASKSALVSTISEEIVNKNAVLINEPYNFVTISKELGLQVKDRNDRERVRLGNYAEGKYGLLLKDSKGVKTVLDEDGIMQSWQEGRTDNVDKGHPLFLYVYIPETTRVINNAILRFRRERFRAYSGTTETERFRDSTSSMETSTYTSTSNAGGTLKSTEVSGTGISSTQYHTMEKGEIVTDNTETHFGTHNHGISLEHVKLKGKRPNTSGPDTYFDFVPSGAHHHGSHYHKIEQKPHSHRMTITPHAHRLTIPGHSHTVEIPAHSHNIEFGIYEKSYPGAVRIRVNGRNITEELGGPEEGFVTDQSNLNIQPYLRRGQWNTIELDGSRLGRIDATVFIQALMNT